MDDWIKTLLSELHVESLKHLGFRKKARTFSRDCGTYWERFNFQGSSWNSTGIKWRFYLNVGIEFKDIAPERYWSYFANTHWANRIDHLLPNAPKDWDYNQSTNKTKLKLEIIELIKEASVILATQHNNLRENYIETKIQSKSTKN